MSPTTPDDEAQLPPPSAQQQSCIAAPPRRTSTAAIPRRDDRVSKQTSQAVQACVALDESSNASADDRRASSHRTHNARAPTASSMNSARSPPVVSGNAAQASLGSKSSAHPHLPSVTAAAAPTRTFFDPWNTSSTGHQRAENRLSGSVSWRESRSLKLAEQYRDGLRGGKRRADTVGAGSTDFGKDGRKENGGWERGAKGLRTGGQKSLAEVWGKSKASMTAKRSSQEEKNKEDDLPALPDFTTGPEEAETTKEHDAAPESESQNPGNPHAKQIFRGLCFYINGSTMPLVSDHKMKYLLSAHGASQSIALGRRTVTHVILGTSCGGGLAHTKLQKEIARTGGKSVKFVTAEWVLESISASKRLPESRFSPLKLAPKGQTSILGNLLPHPPPVD